MGFNGEKWVKQLLRIEERGRDELRPEDLTVDGRDLSAEIVAFDVFGRPYYEAMVACAIVVGLLPVGLVVAWMAERSLESWIAFILLGLGVQLCLQIARLYWFEHRFVVCSRVISTSNLRHAMSAVDVYKVEPDRYVSVQEFPLKLNYVSRHGSGTKTVKMPKIYYGDELLFSNNGMSSKRQAKKLVNQLERALADARAADR